MKAPVFFVVACCLAISSAAASEIRMGISDLISDVIEAPLEAFAEERDFNVSLESMGSIPAMDRLRAGEIDLAIIAVPEGSDIPDDEYGVLVIAYDSAVFVVNERNPIEELSLGELGGIFGETEELRVTNWGDLGLTGWGNRSVKAVSGAEKGSISMELFRHTVLNGSIKSNVAQIDPNEVEELLDSDPGSIAILSTLPEGSESKVLMLSATSGATSFGPTEDNIHYGDYPIRLPFYMIYEKGQEASLGEIFRFMLDDTLADELRSNGLSPVPDTLRRQRILDIEMSARG